MSDKKNELLPLLHDAVLKDQVAEIKELLAAEPELLNARNKDGNTILHIAVMGGHLKIVKILLTQKVLDLNANNELGETALHLAVHYGHLDLVNLLLTKAPNLIENEYGMPVIIRRKTTALLAEGRLLNVKAKDIFGNIAMHIAIACDRFDITKAFLAKGLDLNTKNEYEETVLHVAVWYGYLGMVQKLLPQEGLDLNAQNEFGETALHIAVHCGCIKIVEVLLETDSFDLNAKDNDGNTILHIAVHCGYLDIVNLLLTKIFYLTKNEHGIPVMSHRKNKALFKEGRYLNLKATDLFGNTALHIAVSCNRLDIVKVLLANGAYVNSRNNYQETALYLASENGSTDIVKLLLEQEGIDLNAENEIGETALHLVAWYGHPEIVEALLAKDGLDVNAKDTYGDTAQDLAIRNSHFDISTLLTTYRLTVEIDSECKYKPDWFSLLSLNYLPLRLAPSKETNKIYETNKIEDEPFSFYSDNNSFENEDIISFNASMITC